MPRHVECYEGIKAVGTLVLGLAVCDAGKRPGLAPFGGSSVRVDRRGDLPRNHGHHYGRLTYDLVGAAKLGDGARPQQEIEARLESVEQCYRLELGLYPDTDGSLTLQLKRLRDPEVPNDMVLEDSLQDPDLAKCALDAVDDIVHATSLY